MKMLLKFNEDPDATVLKNYICSLNLIELTFSIQKYEYL